MINLSALVDCQSCGITFDGCWSDDSMSVQDMAEPPEAEQVCPGCGHRESEVFPGWCWRGEAG